jgi:hypothetical protein
VRDDKLEYNFGPKIRRKQKLDRPSNNGRITLKQIIKKDVIWTGLHWIKTVPGSISMFQETKDFLSC